MPENDMVLWRRTKMRTQRKQVVIKLKGDNRLIEELLELLEQRTQGITSKVMSCDNSDDYHAFCTIFEVTE